MRSVKNIPASLTIRFAWAEPWVVFVIILTIGMAHGNLDRVPGEFSAILR